MNKEYTLTPKELRELKKKLTKAKKKNDPRLINSTIEHAFSVFDKKGYPDCWADWERAKQ